MADREKVIKGLECCAFSKRGDKCEQCPYFSGCETEYGAFVELAYDALALLKAQVPHLLTLDEIHDSMVVYLEAGTKFLKIVDDDGMVLAIGGSERMGAKCFLTVWDVSTAAMNDEYNVTWRAWSQRPTKEQREREPWDRRTRNDQR